MKTYHIFVSTSPTEGFVPSDEAPFAFKTLEEAHLEMTLRIFKLNLHYKIVEFEDQQS